MNDTIEPVCNCQDLTINTPCPVHSKPMTETKFGQEAMIITDAQLASPKMETYMGHVFNCLACGKPGIMHNADLGNFCCVCGIAVSIKSETVTKYIRSKY